MWCGSVVECGDSLGMGGIKCGEVESSVVKSGGEGSMAAWGPGRECREDGVRADRRSVTG